MKKIICLDVGKKRIGVAASDLLQLLAQPVYTIQRKNTLKAIDEIVQIIQSMSADTLVIGYPRNMDGSEGFQARETKRFGDNLKEKMPDLKIVYWDERLSSKMAKQSLSHMSIEKMKEKKLIDTVAAVHILQSYLDSKKITEGL